MILGRKDRQYVKDLEEMVEAYKEQAINESIVSAQLLENSSEYQAVKFLNYLHDEVGLSYTKIASTLGLSQQYVNSICIGKSKVRNESLYKILAKLFIKD